MLSAQQCHEYIRRLIGTDPEFRGQDGGRAETVMWMETQREDGRINPTNDEVKAFLEHLIGIDHHHHDPTTFLVYLDREDGRFRTLVLITYDKIQEFANDSTLTGESLHDFMSGRGGADCTEDIMVFDYGTQIPSFFGELTVKTATPLQFDILSKRRLEERMGSLNRESFQQCLVTNGGVLNRILYDGVQVPVVMVIAFTGYSDAKDYSPLVPAFVRKDKHSAYGRLPWYCMKFGEESSIAPCDFSIEEIEKFATERPPGFRVFNWPLCFQTSYLRESRYDFISNVIYFRKMGSNITAALERSHLDDIKKSGFVDGQLYILHSKYSVSGLPCKDHPRAALTGNKKGDNTAFILSKVGKEWRFVGGAIRSSSDSGRSIDMVIAANVKSKAIEQLFKRQILNQLATRRLAAMIKSGGLKSLENGSVAVLRTPDGFIQLGSIKRSAGKKSITFNLDATAKIIALDQKSIETYESVIAGVRTSNKRLEQTLEYSDLINRALNELRRKSEEIATEQLANIKKQLDLSKGKNVSSLLDTRNVDAYGGITTEFVLELIKSLGPMDWGCAIIKGHVLWYKNKIRYDSRESSDVGNMTPSTSQRKEMPYIRWETPMRAMILLSKAKGGWRVTTRVTSVGRHPNIGTGGTLCHGSVENSVLTDLKGGNIVDEMNKKNGSFTLKEALRCANTMADLLTASLAAGDSGRGFNRISLSATDSRAIPLLKQNIFTNIDKLTEEQQKEIKKIHKGIPPVLLPPNLLDVIHDGLTSEWFWNSSYKTAKQTAESLVEMAARGTREEGGVTSIREYGSAGGGLIQLAINERTLVAVSTTLRDQMAEAGIFAPSSRYNPNRRV